STVISLKMRGHGGLDLPLPTRNTEDLMRTILGRSLLVLSVTVWLPLDAFSLWQQPWFRASLLIALASALYAGHRFRIERAVALERLRSQIATDLHDEIGSGLSQISILSGAAERLAGGREVNLRPLLFRIGEVSRELADSMSDIVWTIDPKQDHLGDLI